ncbi:MAG: hypothetical protein AAB546_03075 [Patescibacteria group bacterium]
MKKALILADTIGQKKETFVIEIQKRLPDNCRIYLARLSDICFYIEQGKVEMSVVGLSSDIKDYDFVYIRRAGKTFGIVAATVAAGLDFLGVKYIDKTWAEIGPLGSKMTSLMKLAVANVNIIPTFYCWNTAIAENKQIIIAKFGFPIVAKELGTQLGKGVYLIESEADFATLPIQTPERKGENQYLFQKFILKKDEYRFLVLGNQVKVAEKKIATTENEFRNNVSLGAREEFLEVSSISKEIQDMAVGASQALNIQIAGVDITTDIQGNSWVLEVNRGPGLTYDTQVSPELTELANFIKRELQS